MSTAVLEAPGVEAANFEMPPIAKGQLVMVWVGNVDDRRIGSLALVHDATPASKPRQLVVQAFSRGTSPSEGLITVERVVHIDDPRAREEWVKRDGAVWDYTPHDKAVRAEIDALKATVARLVSDLGGPSTKSKKSE